MQARATYNKVLVTPLQDNSIIKLSGVDVYLDTTFQKEKHAITCGRVVSVPTQIDDTLNTDIEIKVGDVVFFHYLSVINALKDDRYFIEMSSKEIIYPVLYESLYCARRDNAIIPLNGYILVAPILKHKEEKIGNIFLPETMLKQEVVSRGVVAYHGKPRRNEKQLCGVGDTVLFRKSSAVPIQYDLHDSVGEKLYRMKSDSIMGIISQKNSSEETIHLTSALA
jgi:co-chaperonin GroES (HSP10)